MWTSWSGHVINHVIPAASVHEVLMEDIPVAGVPSPSRPPTAAGTLVLEQEEGLRWLELWLQSSQQPVREKMEPASVAGLAMTPAQPSCSFSAVVCREIISIALFCCTCTYGGTVEFAAILYLVSGYHGNHLCACVKFKGSNFKLTS